jgi:hypothetical protein
MPLIPEDGWNAPVTLRWLECPKYLRMAGMPQIPKDGWNAPCYLRMAGIPLLPKDGWNAPVN